MTMKTMNKKFRSYNQYQLKVLSDTVCDRIEDLLSALDISEYKIFEKMISMACPIHGGDNDSAFNLYHKGDNYRGNWKCRTHGCEQYFKSSVLGFIRGVLSRNQYYWSKNGDDMVSFNEAIDFAIQFSKYDPSKDKQSKKLKEKKDFILTVKNITSEISLPNNLIPRESVKANLAIPSQYFLTRGFTANILIKYDVGDCADITKEMFNRAVVPIYDNDMKGMIGCTGRSIYDKCHKCSSFHDPNNKCPDRDYSWQYCKWKHSKNFKTQDSLYNYWFAQKYIKELKSVILVESPGNVWRLEEAGIHNSVALYGSSLNDKQKMLLDISGAMKIITIMDNDDAGHNAAKTIASKCNRIYNIKNIVLATNDLADMTVDEINNTIKPQIEEYN